MKFPYSISEISTAVKCDTLLRKQLDDYLWNKYHSLVKEYFTRNDSVIVYSSYNDGKMHNDYYFEIPLCSITSGDIMCISHDSATWYKWQKENKAG